MKAGSKELIEEVNIFYGIFDHKPDESEIKLLLGRQGIGDLVDSGDGVMNEQWKTIRRYRWVFRYLPFVKMVAVCNAVAMNTADKNSDIDLFVITGKDRIFLGRVIMTLIFHFLGVRRHGRKITNRFCLTFFVTLESMKLADIAKKEDVYLKFWLLTLKPLFGNNIFEDFMRENGAVVFHKEMAERKTIIAGTIEWILGGKIGDLIEKRLSESHIKRWRKLEKEIGDNHGIIVSNTRLKFHNIDMREHFRREFEKRGGKFINTISFS